MGKRGEGEGEGERGQGKGKGKGNVLISSATPEGIRSGCKTTNRAMVRF